MYNHADFKRDLELFDFQPGQIMMNSKRFLLMNADSLGTLRRDLISNLGSERAKGFMIRYGWYCGYNDALSVKKQFPHATPEFLQQKGPSMHMLEGIVHAQISMLDIDLDKGKFFIDGIWKNSYEAEQHISHFGVSREPVCWTLLGYAGGYSSGLFSRKILYKEVACVGRGDDHCHFVGKPVEDWGEEIISDLPYYSEAKIAEELEKAYHQIQQQNKLLQQITGIHEQLNQMVLAGQDRQKIIETIGTMLGAPIIVEDRYNHPIVWWIPSDSKFDLENYLLGPHLKQNQNLRSWLHKVEKEKRAIDWVETDHTKGLLSRTTAPIILGEELIGYLSVIHTNGTQEELRHMMTARAAAVMGLDLLKERIKLETEHRLKGDFLDELLDESKSVFSLQSRARYMGYDLDRPHRFLLIEIDPTWVTVRTEKEQKQFLGMRKTLFDLVQSVVNKLNKHSMVIERSNGIVILAYTGADGLSIPQAVSEIQARQFEVLGSISISICISRESLSIEQLRTAFPECRNTLQVMVKAGRLGEVIYVEKMKTFDLLYAGPSQDQLLLYSKHLLAKLLQYDESYGGQLTQTLHVFLANDCNLQQTARALNISLSGLKYRLQRLQEVGGLTWDDPDERFNLQLALRILKANGIIKLTEDS